MSNMVEQPTQAQHTRTNRRIDIMKHDQELYDKARGEMLTDMLDYIPADLIAEVLADEWVLSVKPGCFVNALYDALCDCLEDDTVEQYIRYGMNIETPEETLERLEEERTHERRV